MAVTTSSCSSGEEQALLTYLGDAASLTLYINSHYTNHELIIGCQGK